MKKLLFVSIGRCGTKRIAQILSKYLPESFSVVHQMPFSRLANLIGNILYYFGSSEIVKHALYNFITSSYSQNKFFICSDPLTSMIIPREQIVSEDVCIVHIIRDSSDFAESFFRLSRKRLTSLIAHNFVPFWQLNVWPFENLLSKNIKKKYMKIAKLKNSYFNKIYSSNPNYIKIDMIQIFNSDFLKRILFEHFYYEAIIPERELKIKAN